MNSQNSSNSCAQCSAGPSNPLLAIDYDGTIYPCDHFWEDSRFSIGNIEEMTLDEASKSLKNFRNNKEFGELENCVTCDWKRVCGGGCPGEGMLTNQDNIAKLQEDF